VTLKPFQLLQRGKAWKAYIEQTLGAAVSELSRTRQDVAKLQAEGSVGANHAAVLQSTLDSLSAKLDRLALRQAIAARQEGVAFRQTAVDPLLKRLPERVASLDTAYRVLLSRRGTALLVLFLNANEACACHLDGLDPVSAVAAVADGSLHEAIVIVPDGAGRPVMFRDDLFLVATREMAIGFLSWAEARKAPPNRPTPIKESDYFTRLECALDDLDRLDFHALGAANMPQADIAPIIPFDEPALLQPLLWAEPVRKSTLLLHNNYYHYNCLAAGLRQRGWDVITVSLESPESSQRQFYHGEDLNLFDPDPAIMLRKTREFFRSVPERYGSLHFYGQGLPSLFPAFFENTAEPRLIPWDFLELRRHRIVIGYMPSGCLDGGLQSSIRRQAENVCGRCVWERRPDVCNDAKNFAWNRKLALLCDWVGLEGDHATPERVGSKTVYGPVVTALDPERWHSGIEIPEAMRMERAPGEILIYHAVGNYALRRDAERDIKGTGAILAAIDRLRAEGLPVRLVFAHDVPSTQVRFLQVQADIVVDQLNYGRYGANAREAMMLGKPAICHLNPAQASPLPPLRAILETPLVNADETSVTEVLRALVLAPERRLELGRRSRAFAVAWHGQDAAAERYERVVERVRAGLPADAPDLYPAIHS